MDIVPSVTAIPSILCILLSVHFIKAEASENGRNGKQFAADFAVGLPQLIGLELSYIGFSKFAFGLGFGSLPIQKILDSQITLSPIPVTSVGDSTFSFVPSATYRFYGAEVFGRFYPWDSGLFTQAGYALWNFHGSISGALQNDTLGTSFNDVLSGSLAFSLPMITTSIGYQWIWNFGLFIDAGIGASILLKPSYSLSISGTATTIAELLPDASAQLDSARDQLSSQIDSALQSLSATVPVLPNIYLAIGWAF